MELCLYGENDMWLHILHGIRDFRPNMKHIPRATNVIATGAMTIVTPLVAGGCEE